MEMTNVEAAVIEQGLFENKHPDLCELSDLQLALVGGGMGETINA